MLDTLTGVTLHYVSLLIIIMFNIYIAHMIKCALTTCSLVKAIVTRGNLSLQLAMQFLPKKILQVAVRMSDVRNLFCDLQ